MTHRLKPVGYDKSSTLASLQRRFNRGRYVEQRHRRQSDELEADRQTLSRWRDWQRDRRVP
jgi:hypothetical protein